jgi:hypothetical protein
VFAEGVRERQREQRMKKGGKEGGEMRVEKGMM